MIGILVVAASANLPELDGTFLRRSGFTIDVLGVGENVVARVQSLRPSIVLLDGHDHGCDVASICASIRSNGEFASLKVLAVGTPSDQERWSGAAVDGTISHPITTARLLEAARRHLEVQERTVDRLPFALKVDYRRADGTEGTAYTRDVGAQGIFLLTSDSLRIGEEIQLELLLPHPAGRSLRATGVVVRTVASQQDAHHLTGVGIRFHELSATDRVEIGRLVRNRGVGGS